MNRETCEPYVLQDFVVLRSRLFDLEKTSLIALAGETVLPTSPVVFDFSAVWMWFLSLDSVGYSRSSLV